MGVLALQGAFEAHLRALARIGVEGRAIRIPSALDGVDRLIVPGGESTTISRLLGTSGLFEPIAHRLAEGMPVFGTCAGAILLGRAILDGRSDQRHFDVIDLVVRRNGYGRQVDSFEADLAVGAVRNGDEPFHAIFIRAPRIESAGADVEVLATYDSSPVVCRSGAVLVAAFHPELTGDDRLHELFCSA